MDNFNAEDWLKRARGNLNRGKECHNLEERGVYIEDLCFDLQQSAEKALKAVLVKYQFDFPKTHDISELIRIIKLRTTIKVPDFIKESAGLTKYGVLTRYPHWNKISDEDYKQAVKIAEDVYEWAKELINEP